MNTKQLLSAVIIAALVCLMGCASGKSSSGSKPETARPPSVQSNSGALYYGADLFPFPPKIREWIMREAFPRYKMEQQYMINPQLRVWWGNDNNAVYAEASYTVASGYVGAGTRTTWGQGTAYRGSSEIFTRYGEYARYHTLRYKWELKQEAERLIANDLAYAEIIAFAKQLCREIEYDWASFSGYSGRPVRRTPNLRYAVCDGYSNEVMDKVLALRSVRSVEKWTSTGHAWNVLRLVDGRTLYFDLTWFDNEHINHETGVIYQTDDYDWANITFNETLFHYANVGYGTRVFHHTVGRLDRTRTK
ncbi:MAG: hypothetical protein LBI28_12500 [Treponema sp.]|jgi:hypothetical protein|nr:hypothetical protein [Treponema sp.]